MPAKIRTYAELSRTLTTRAGSAFGNLENRSNHLKPTTDHFVMKEGRVTSQDKRKPVVGELLYDENGRELGVFTRINDDGTIDMRSTTGYHHAGVQMSQVDPTWRQVQLDDAVSNEPFSPHTYVKTEANLRNRKLNLLRADNFRHYEEDRIKLQNRLHQGRCPDCGVDPMTRIWSNADQVILECDRCHHQFFLEGDTAYRQYP